MVGLEFAYKRVWDFIRIARVYLHHYKHFIAALDGPVGTNGILCRRFQMEKRLCSDSSYESHPKTPARLPGIPRLKILLNRGDYVHPVSPLVIHVAHPTIILMEIK